MIEASGLSITGGSGDGDPVLNDDLICLNGDGDEGYETFSLSRKPLSGGGFGDSTKTAYKPYDDIVTAILIRATQLLGSDYMDQGGREGEEIITDGVWEDWLPGRNLVQKVFPNDDIVCPWVEEY